MRKIQAFRIAFFAEHGDLITAAGTRDWMIENAIGLRDLWNLAPLCKSRKKRIVIHFKFKTTAKESTDAVMFSIHLFSRTSQWRTASGSNIWPLIVPG